MGRLRLLAAATGLVLVLVACGTGSNLTSAPLAPEPEPLTDGAFYRVEVGRAVYAAEVAASAPTLALGLSGREGLGPGAAMLFDLGSERESSFWMRGMRFALDIVWVRADWSIVAVSREVLPPAPGTADAALPLYSPGEPVRFVLEVPAGDTTAYAIEPGVHLRVYAQ